MSAEKVNSIADVNKVVDLRPYFKQKELEVKDQIPLPTLDKIEEISSSSRIVYINTIFNRKRRIKISGRTDINIILNRIKKVKKKRNANKLCLWIHVLSNYCCWNYLIFLTTYFHI